MTPYQYLMIDVANNAGFDKKLWEERLDWVRANMDDLESIEGDSPLMYKKSVRALRDAQNGIPIGHPCALDATASFLQVFAVLSGCKKTAYQCNLTNSEGRQDFYTNLTIEMNRLLDDEIDIERDVIKYVAMPVFYGSKMLPISLFGEGTPAYVAFYQALQNLVPGACKLMGILMQSKPKDPRKREWVLPDNFHAITYSKKSVKIKVEVPEMVGSFTYEGTIRTPNEKEISFMANFIQSIDAYLVRAVVRQCHWLGIEVLTIHDSYHTLANNMEALREVYKATLCNLSRMDLLNTLLNQVEDNRVPFTKYSDDLYLDIQKSEYSLS